MTKQRANIKRFILSDFFGLKQIKINNFNRQYTMGRKTWILTGFIAIILFLTGVPARAQFYNGLNMSFGKNRIQYPRTDVLESEFFASFYRFDRYDVYFYPEGRELAEYVSRVAYKEMAKLENYFEFSLSKRLVFLVYNRLSDYRQSNIGLISGKDESNIGGVTKILDNKVFLYFDGDYRKFDQQIKAAITEVLLQEMIYGGSMRERLASSTLVNLPDWFYRGLISFVAQGWDVEIENRVKDGILSGKFDKFNNLEGQNAVDAGRSIWYFISETFGKSVIPTIVYFTRINRNSSSGFLNVLGTNINALSYEWLHFFKTRYSEAAHQGELPNDQLVKLKNRKGTDYLRARISPDGRYIAYTSNSEGQLRVRLYDTKTNKSRKIFQTGAKLGQIQDYSFPVLAWHPSSGLLAMIMEEKGKIRFSLYPVDTRKWEHQEIKQMSKILDFSYSDDGLNLVLSAVKNGQSDIYVYSLVARTFEQLTNDRADDFAPKFIDKSTRIIFTSDRKDLSLESQKEKQEEQQNLDIYIYDYVNRSDKLTRLAEDKYVDRFQPERLSDNKYYYLGDDNGLRNRYVAKFDSTLLSIDTTEHYAFSTKSSPLTNYGRNILDQSFSKSTNEWSSLFYAKGKYQLARGTLNVDQPALPKLPVSSYRAKLSNDLASHDSIEALATAAETKKETPVPHRPLLLSSDTTGQKSVVNINNYIFEAERNTPLTGKLKKLAVPTAVNPVTGRVFDLPVLRIYQPSFYINHLASQIDFTYLDCSYQAYGGGANSFNKGLNFQFQVGTQDLFEDYKITAAASIDRSLLGNELLLSFENLKKRLDKEVIFHRLLTQGISRDSTAQVNMITNELFYLLKYPFSQVSAIKASINGRIDNYTFLATDPMNLLRKDSLRYLMGLKLEYIFDNTRMTGLNLYEGLRLKLFGEFYQQISPNTTDVFILGADVRHYLPLHRSLIWANRVAASTSFGRSRLLYYMGGVDQSIIMPKANNQTGVDPYHTFIFQTIATNMRGFSQNIRNGNSFVVYNSELRWPIFRYFANKPINSDFLNNFQIIGFFDVGTAWSGPTPWDPLNHLNIQVIDQKSLHIVVHKINDPFVEGFGCGLRSRLLGYFIRADWAWGIENNILLPRVFYLSLSLDF